MGGDVVLRRRRLGGYALGASGLALGMALASPAAAQCSPDPTIAYGTTTCTGTDTDGLTVTTVGTNVSVSADAVVRGAGAPAIAIRIGSDAGFGAPVRLAVSGLVDGGAAAGVSLVSQDGGFYDQRLNVTVAALGRVTGTNGIVVARGTAQSFLTPYVNIDNSGTILGTSGVALLSTDPAFGGFASIYNRSGGIIGAIVGAGGTITNLGSIDGGDRSAVEWAATGSRFYGDITNAGTITSTSAAGTLANIPGFQLIANRGTIENRGVGAAISSSRGLSITNAATGRIASAGTTAIMVGDTIQLINAGTVVGDVLAGGTDSYSGSLIDSTAGRITGSVRFGAGADSLVGRYDGTGLQYGIDGAIDGGAGIDAIRVSFEANASVAAPLTRPTGFERLVMVPAAGVTATLAPGFVAPGTLLLGGAGTLVNAAVLTGSGQT